MRKRSRTLNYEMQIMKTDAGRGGGGREGGSEGDQRRALMSSITYQFRQISNRISTLQKTWGNIHLERLYDSLHLQVAVSVVPFDHVRNTLTTLHPRFDQLGEHLENPLAGASALLPENGRGDTAKLEPKVVLLSVPPPLLEIQAFHFWRKGLGFDGSIVRLVRKAGGGGWRGRGVVVDVTGVDGEGDCAFDGGGKGGLQGSARVMCPIALLLVEGGQVIQEGERVVCWLDRELGCGRGLGRGWEMGSLHRLDGQGRRERRKRWGPFSSEAF